MKHLKVQHLHRSFKIISHGVDLNTNHKYLNHLVVVIRPDGIHIADRPQHSRTVFVMILISISDVFELHASICLGVYTHSNGMSWCHLTGTMKHHKLWIIKIEKLSSEFCTVNKISSSFESWWTATSDGTWNKSYHNYPATNFFSSQFVQLFLWKIRGCCKLGMQIVDKCNSVTPKKSEIMRMLQFYLAQKSIQFVSQFKVAVEWAVMFLAMVSHILK